MKTAPPNGKFCGHSVDPMIDADEEIVRCIWNGGHEWGPQCAYDSTTGEYMCGADNAMSALIWKFLSAHAKKS